MISLEANGSAGLFRITRIAQGAARRVSAQAVEPAIFPAAPGRAAGARPHPPPLVAGPPEAIVLRLAAAPSDPAPLQYAAIAASPWPGAVAIWRSGDGASFSLLRLVTLPAVIGRTLTPCPAGPLWRWDRTTTVDVTLSQAALSAIDDNAALAGGNLLALEGPDGVWEILSAARVDLIGARSYRLSRLLRGLAGSEDAALRPVPAGARVVRLDEAVVPLTSALDDLGRSWIYRIGPADRDHADPTYVTLTAQVAGDALRPLRPVHLSARRSPEGVIVAWIRRTRRDGDGWEALDVPLGEASEAYALDILSGASPVRTLSSDTASVLYPAAAELADFGSPQTNLSLRLAQLSAAVGRGFDTQTTIEISPG